MWWLRYGVWRLRYKSLSLEDDIKCQAAFSGVSENIWSITVSDNDAQPKDLSQTSSYRSEDQIPNEVLNHCLI